MPSRSISSLASAAILLLLTGCGDLLSPGGGGPHGLWIGETGVVMEPGETFTLTARIQQRGSSGRNPGSAIETPTIARWWTSDTTVIRIRTASQGRVDALAPGRAVVWVEVGSRRDSANVVVQREDERPVHRWKDVATFDGGTCALDQSGSAFCWGSDYYGDWGTGGDRRQWTGSYRPVQVNTDLKFEEISRGGGFACARTAAGEIWCWGLHLGMNLGHGQTGTHYETAPVRTAFPGRATSLVVGHSHSCALDEQNRAHCWGNNLMFQLGVAADLLGVMETGGRPIPVDFHDTFTELRAGAFSTCGRTPGRDLFCWGSTYGGSPTMGERNRLPSLISTTVPPSAYSPADGSSCFLSESGRVYCWGLNASGAAGHPPSGGFASGFQVPIATSFENTFERIFGNGAVQCGLTADGSAWCWGTSSYGHIDPRETSEPCIGGLAGHQCSSRPIAVTGTHVFEKLSVHRTSCGITTDGELYCWGGNVRGALGNGRPDIESTHIPQRVLDPA